MKHPVSHQVVADLLHELDYSLQANRKIQEGTNHPDRNAQFEHLNGKVKWSLARRQPVISVDTKKIFAHNVSTFSPNVSGTGVLVRL